MATQADLDTLRAAYRNGYLRVQRGDLTITYRSMREMAEAIRDLEDELNPGQIKRQRLAYSTSGWRE